MKRGLVLVGCAAAVALGAASSQAAQPDFIVFSADRMPSVSGEIYLVHPNGRRVDLSRSPSQDVAPAVSSEGKEVAFVSDRTPKGAVYEVGIAWPIRSARPTENYDADGVSW